MRIFDNVRVGESLSKSRKHPLGTPIFESSDVDLLYNLAAHYALGDAAGAAWVDSLNSNHLIDPASVQSVAGINGNAAQFVVGDLDRLILQSYSLFDPVELQGGNIDWCAVGLVSMSAILAGGNVFWSNWGSVVADKAYLVDYHPTPAKWRLQWHDNSKVEFTLAPTLNQVYFVYVEHNARTQQVGISVTPVSAGSPNAVVRANDVVGFHGTPGTSNFVVGGIHSSASHSGTVQRLSIYRNRILTDDQISQHFASGATLAFPFGLNAYRGLPLSDIGNRPLAQYPQNPVLVGSDVPSSSFVADPYAFTIDPGSGELMVVVFEAFVSAIGEIWYATTNDGVDFTTPVKVNVTTDHLSHPHALIENGVVQLSYSEATGNERTLQRNSPVTGFPSWTDEMEVFDAVAKGWDHMVEHAIFKHGGLYWFFCITGDGVDDQLLRAMYSEKAPVRPIDAQDETSYDNSPTSEGAFAGGTGHAVSDVITLSDGTLVTVDAVSSGVVTEFTIASDDSIGCGLNETLTQSSTTGSGTGFTLTPDVDNLTTWNSEGTDHPLSPFIDCDDLDWLESFVEVTLFEKGGNKYLTFGGRRSSDSTLSIIVLQILELTTTTFSYAWLKEDHTMELANNSGWNDGKMHRMTVCTFNGKHYAFSDGSNIDPGANWQIGMHSTPA